MYECRLSGWWSSVFEPVSWLAAPGVLAVCWLAALLSSIYVLTTVVARSVPANRWALWNPLHPTVTTVAPVRRAPLLRETVTRGPGRRPLETMATLMLRRLRAAA